jgi:glyoxylase-like metal-dependent hydrolase (beta-lactamase superfamily II)
MKGNKMGVSKDSFRFKIGHFECLVISDGTFLPPDIPPEHLLSQYNMPLEQTMEVQCLFIRTGEHAVLIDTGWGTGVEPNVGNLIKNLQAEGISNTEVDTIILSHVHPDHIGGNTDADCQPVFPNARYVMCRKEWEFWTSDPDLSQCEESIKQSILNGVQKKLIPIQDQLYLIDGDREIVSGIELIQAPGHTPGHMVTVISSDTEQLLCTGDLVQYPVQIVRPDWCSPADIAPEQAIRTRIEILSRAATPNVLVFAGHFPFPGLGHTVPEGNAWRWQPIEIKGKA